MGAPNRAPATAQQEDDGLKPRIISSNCTANELLRSPMRNRENGFYAVLGNIHDAFLFEEDKPAPPCSSSAEESLFSQT
jgi:hypothetical protein